MRSTVVRSGVVAGFLLAVTFVAFGASLSGGFVWDDRQLLLSEEGWRGLSAEHLGWMLRSRTSGHWHPLTWLSFALDHSLYGLEPRGYHLTNLVLHAANGVLVYALTLALLRAPGPPDPAQKTVRSAGALFAATVFVAHPMRVEAVAWITERGDLLATTFLLGAVLAWLRARGDERTAAGPYVLAVALFAASLLCKAWGMTLPLVLALLAHRPLGRLRRGRIVREALLLVPFAVPAAAAAAVAWFAKRDEGAMDLVADAALLDRLVHAAAGLWYYPAATVLPVGLSPLHLLHDTPSGTPPGRLLAAAAAAVVTVGAVLARRRVPAVLTAWTAYAVLVAPALGIAQSGFQSVADRYSYISCIPLAVLAGGACARVVTGRPAFVRWAPTIVAATLLALLSRAYVPHWRDDVALWSRAVEVDPRNHVALLNRGEARFARGDAEGARADFAAAADLAPTSPRPHNNLGFVSGSLAPPDHERALTELSEALRRDPGYVPALANRAAVLLALGRPREALADAERAILLGDLSPATAAVRARALLAADVDR